MLRSLQQEEFMSLQEKETLELAQAKMQEYLQDNAVCSMDEYV